MANLPIGYYVHHDGSGHMARALTICNHIERPVVMLSSLTKPSALPHHVTYVQLPDDAVDGYMADSTAPYLYTPYSPNVMSRYEILLQTIRSHGLRAIYVDVSPEVAQFCRILGLKIGHAVMHGDRTDSAHSRLYDACDTLLWHNDIRFDTPKNRRTQTPVSYSGGISKLPKRAHKTVSGISSVLVATSRASSSLPLRDINMTAREFPDILWHVVGAISGPVTSPNVILHGIVDDILPLYDSVDLVVGSGGNNTIMEVASQRLPFVCIPEPKPFDEQREAAQALSRLNAAFHESTWPTYARWQEVFATYRSLDLDVFHSLCDDAAPSNAARIISRLDS